LALSLRSTPPIPAEYWVIREPSHSLSGLGLRHVVVVCSFDRSCSLTQAAILVAPLDETEMIMDSLRLDVCLPARVNLLLTGPDTLADAFVRGLHPYLREPVAVLRGGRRFALPSAQVGTLFLADVGSLTSEEQRRLHDWLDDRAGETQVISMSTTSLMPMVAAGSFLAALYYRLNTIYIDITALPSEQAARIPAMRSV
jgi:hypothetical protein